MRTLESTFELFPDNCDNNDDDVMYITWYLSDIIVRDVITVDAAQYSSSDTS